MPEVAEDLQTARRELVEKRVRQAALIGVTAFSLNVVNPWFNFHDLVAVKMQLSVALIMSCLTALLFTAGGKRHILILFTIGFLLAVAGDEAVVCYERAFGTAYSDIFLVFYAFYCVLIPTTVYQTASIGAATLALIALPEAFITSDLSRLISAVLENAPGFAILLLGRQMANTSWERAFAVRRTARDGEKAEAEHDPQKSNVVFPSESHDYSCFISYSSHDKAFAEHLHADLVAKNLRCWFAPEDLKIGDRFQERIEESIQLYDKVMIVLSEASVKSRWVEREVNAAYEREDREKRTVLFPIRIDDAVMKAMQPWAADIRRTRHIGDFREWEIESSYLKALERLMRDLKATDGASKQPD